MMRAQPAHVHTEFKTEFWLPHSEVFASEHVCNSVRKYLEILAGDVCTGSMRHDLHKAQRGVCRPRPPYRPQALGNVRSRRRVLRRRCCCCCCCCRQFDSTRIKDTL